MKKTLSFIFFIFIYNLLIGQQDKLQRFQLGPDDLKPKVDTGQTLVYSASRSSQYIEDLPVTVYVVTREEILNRGYTSLTDVLKDVPGIKVSQPGSAIDGETFLMNGLYGNYYCKIMIDDMPISPSVVSGMPISEQLPIRQAERIEIISGPASTLYGSDAIAGVINIITHSSDRPVWSQADISMGSLRYYNMNVMIGGKAGKNKNVLDYTFYGNFMQRADLSIKYDLENNYDPSLYDTTSSYLNAPGYRGNAHTPEMDDIAVTSSLAGMRLRFRNLSFGFLHMDRKTHSSIGQSPAQVAWYDPARFWGERIDRYTLTYKNKWGNISSTTQLAYLQYRLNNNSSFRLIHDRGNDGVVYKYAASDDLFLEEILSWSLSRNLELSAGASVQVSGNLPQTNELSEPFDETSYLPFSTDVNYSDPVLGSFGINPTNFYNLGVYLQMIYSYKRFVIQLGGRWDEHSIYGSNISPKAGIQFKASKTTSFRASYGHGFRAPSLFYAYNSLAYPVADGKIRYENVPGTGLEAERFRAFELGMRHRIKKQLEIEFIFMYHKLNKNISSSTYILDPPKYPNAEDIPALVWINDENSRAELYSGQINIKGKNLIPSLKLNSDLFITLSKGKEILPNNLGTLHDYRNMPNLFIQFNVDFHPVKSWNVVLRNIWSDSWKKRFFPREPELMEQAGFEVNVAGYYTLDLINKIKINRNFHAFIIINNVLDAQYGGLDAYGNLYDLRYNPQMGRNFKLGLSFNME